jgi:cell division protease FtsH
MSESPNPRRQPPKLPKAPEKRPEDPRSNTNWKGLFLFFAAASILLVAYKIHKDKTSVEKALNFDQFIQLLEKKQVKDVTLYSEPTTGMSWLSGSLAVPAPAEEPATEPPATGGASQPKYKVFVNLEFQKNLRDILADNGFPNVGTIYVNNEWVQALIGILPFLLFILVMYFFFRSQIKMAGKSAFSFGKSKARMLTKDKNKITFKDVAGIEEAKEEVQEIVEFLRDPKKFQRLGGRIPKGVLMVGPPGTGKTLLAKAIAGEADVPFYGISGSDFVEMFVGVGASRVRDMFEQGRRNAPCLIFIDEIDAVGRSRGHGVGGGHDEREQTLNALLVEMDGIDSSEGVIMIAATNRKDVLDPALLRPGRFDREVRVSLPDVKGREEILRVHARSVKLSPAVDLLVIARGTPGFSGAELSNLINEAALIAARREADHIEMADLEEARDKVRWGRERRSMAMTEEQKRITAYHEAGHALLNVLMEHTDPLHKVTIIPRGPALGVTMMLPKEDRYGYERRRILDDMCVIMGGRVAEEFFIGDISSGASGDIRMATWYARKMICEWGMSQKLGMVEYGEHEDYVFLGRDISRSRGYSEQTAREIDQEVLGLTTDAYNRAKELIGKHRTQVELIAKALLEYESLDGQHIEDLIKQGRMNNPPPKSLPPEIPPSTEAKLAPGSEEPRTPVVEDGLPGGLTGPAPA